MAAQEFTRFEDKGAARRKYPRRALNRKVGVLSSGTYFVCFSGEIGEGGMSITSEFLLTEGHEVVVSLQIPDGDFVFLKGTVRSTVKKMGDNNVTHGLIFNDISFAIKRQIRTFVSART